MPGEDEVRVGGEEEEEEQDIEEIEETPRGWTPGEGALDAAEVIYIDTGRGGTAEAQVGAPFVETIERVADEFHYGGFFRVFLNGEEQLESPWLNEEHTELNPDYPDTIESGMRIAITSYDKVG